MIPVEAMLWTLGFGLLGYWVTLLIYFYYKDMKKAVRKKHD